MKKHLFFTMLAATALVGFAGCSDSDDLASIDTGTTQAAEETPVSFGTYLGNAKSTRSGLTGAIDNAGLANGFGIFAINTATKLYNDNDVVFETTGNNEYNYMNNIKVSGTQNAPASTYSWSYSPLKYWPNQTKVNGEFKDQFVSFFAYAPYVDKPTGSQTYGILEFKEGKDFATEGFKVKDVDPVISYSAAVCQDEGVNKGKQVDLLWGTTGTTKGEAANSTDPNANTGKSYNTTEGDVANGVKVNADLTKMKVDQKVDFAFKHTLAKFGGRADNISDNKNITIDANSDVVRTEAGATSEQIADVSKVYVNWIVITIKNASTTEGAKIPIKGDFNLVNGKWNVASETSTTEGDTQDKFIYVIKPNRVVTYGGITTPNATTDKLADVITQYNEASATDITDADASKIIDQTLNTNLVVVDGSLNNDGTWKNTASDGVTTTAQDVLTDNSQPLLFLPGLQPKIEVAVCYNIQTADSKLQAGVSNASQVQIQEVEFPNTVKLIGSKKYKLQIHLGLTSIKVNASVNDWVEGNKTTDPTSGDTKTDVDLPLNVN